MFYDSIYPSPVGKLTLTSDGTNLVGVWIENQKYFGRTVPKERIVKEDLLIFQKTKHWLVQYFHGEKPDIQELPLKPEGSKFQKQVWEILCEIPYGTVTTYGEIAKKIACLRETKTMSAQAVGGAIGHNPIAIIIPCHRVIGSNGKLTGYAGGIEVKKQLLDLEQVNILNEDKKIRKVRNRAYSSTFLLKYNDVRREKQ